MKSIKVKLVMYFSILVLVSSVSIGFISVWRADNALTEQAEGALKLAAYEAARFVDARLGAEQAALEVIARRTDIISMEWEKQQPLLTRLLTQTNFLDLGISDLTGNMMFNDGTTLNIADRQYFKNALNGTPGVSDIIISRISNEPELRYSTPIKRGDKIVGVLVGRIDAYTLSNMINEISFGENGYAYMINSEGTTVAHRDQTIIA